MVPSLFTQDVVIKPAGADKHRVELQLRDNFGGPDTSRIIYVTDEVPAVDEVMCEAARKSLCAWASCCFGLPERSGDDSEHESDQARDGHNVAIPSGPPASVVDDGASQHSRKTHAVSPATKGVAPLPPSYLIIDTVMELKRVLESVKEEKKQSDFAVARLVQSSVGVSQPPIVGNTQATKAGIVLPDVPRPKGPNSIRPRLPTSLTTVPSSPFEVSNAADESDASPWGALTEFEGGGSVRAMQERAIQDRLSSTGGSLRGPGSLVGHAFAATGAGLSVSSISNSMSASSDFSRPVFHRRAPTAARNAPAATAMDPSQLSALPAASVARPPLAAIALTPIVASRQVPLFVPPAPPSAPAPLSYTAPSAAVATPLRDVPHSSTAPPAPPAPAAVPFPTVVSARVPSQDVAAPLQTVHSTSVVSQVVPAPPAPTLPDDHVPSSVAAAPSPTIHRASVLSQAAATPLSNVQQQQQQQQQHVSAVPRVLVPSQNAVVAQLSTAPQAAPSLVVASDTAILERILSDIAATPLLPRFISDYIDDGDLSALAVTKPAKLMSKYGLNESQVAAFISECQQASTTENQSRQPLPEHHNHASAAGHRNQQAQQLPFAASPNAAGTSVQTFAPRPQISMLRPLPALLSGADSPRTRPPLPPMPTSFEK